jgi:O-antigen ligase
VRQRWSYVPFVKAWLLAMPVGGLLGLTIASFATATTAIRTEHVHFAATIDLPRAEFAAFLRSTIGIWTTFGVWIVLVAVTFAVAWRLLERAEPRPGKPSSKRASRRQRTSGPNIENARVLSRFTAAWLIAGALLLPLAFTIALEDVFALPKTIVLRVLAIVTGVLLLVALARRLPVARVDLADIALVVFLLIAAVSTVVSDRPELSFHGLQLQHQGFIAFAAYVIMFLGGRFALGDVIRVRLLSAAMLIAASVVSLYACLQWLGLDPIWDSLFKDRVFSTVGQANALGSTLAMALALSLALIPGERRWVRGAVAGVDVLIAFGLLLSLSRGAYLGLAAAAAVAALTLAPGISRASVLKRAPRLLGIAGAVLVGVLLLTIAWRPASQFVGQVASRAASITNPSESSNLSHIDLWTVGARIAIEHPLFGMGLDTYVEAFPEYRDQVLRPDRAAIMARFRPESPHNVYLAIAGGAGVFALAAYLTVIVATFYSAIRASRRSLSVPERLAIAALAAGATVHLVTDSFMTGEPGSSATFWIVLGSLAGLAARLRSATQTEQAQGLARTWRA